MAVQTVYFAFRDKRALFKDVVDMSIAGDAAPVATMDRNWFGAACAEPTAAGQLRAHVRRTGHPRPYRPIMSLITAAAVKDPEIAAQWPAGPASGPTRAAPSSTPQLRR
ncbi:hypothetical protein NFX46_21670 [Streptomyces phaeoluteigriseus]|uniref:TetR family transcriptional regulator n=1 Tax=Streptomyces phaeoluteigriseus TaxID=114686 RepID=A0ABY4ZAU5_9ACTN|nr:hypothetical protein [Streptomyces phaeoluteigriseus]USQ86091.1 hypothetical protein NFX46_21670 [Streptomyces phaeoluteigriseus]